jgi:hypothetical protein
MALPISLFRRRPTDLDVQLQEILECVWREEQMWSLERRIHGSLRQRLRKPRRPER